MRSLGVSMEMGRDIIVSLYVGGVCEIVVVEIIVDLV